MATLVVGFDEFLGAAVTDILLNRGEQVYGVSLESDDTAVQLLRKNRLLAHNNTHHLQDAGMFARLPLSPAVFTHPIQKVLFLPGYAFIHNNKAQLLADTLAVIALCKQLRPAHLVAASHYSIYYPHDVSTMSCQEALNHPPDLEAATCRAAELLFHGLCASSDIPCSVVRLFDIYGPDADSNNLISTLISHFSDNSDAESLTLDNDTRDFIWIDDAAQGVCRILDHTAQASPEWQHDTERPDISEHPFSVYNLGTGKGTSLTELMQTLRQLMKHSLNPQVTLHSKSKKIVAETDKLVQQTGFIPDTDVKTGLSRLLASLSDQQRPAELVARSD